MTTPGDWADVTWDVEIVEGEPAEGDRTGNYLLDYLLDEAEQALREKLEPNVTELGIGSKQGTGDAQLDDLLHRADTALRIALESRKRQKLLAHGAAVMFGTAVLGADRRQWLPSPAPAPSNIGMADVKKVEAATRAMRALDYQFGGGACRNAVVTQLSWAQRLLGSSGTEAVRLQLFRALADLQNLAGWTTFDVGLLDSSRDHFATALEFAKQSGDSGLMSNIMYRIGRVYLHHGDANDALKWFHLGQIAAQDSGSELAVAVLCGNEAWAYAMMGDDVQAKKLLGRSRDELARANPDDTPDWAKFYNDTDMYAMIGTVHNELAAYDPRHAAVAIPAFGQALARYDDSMGRSQAFNLTMLATSYLRQGDVDHGIQVGRRALLAASAVKSKRVTDRLKPLEIEAARRSTNPDSRDLAHLIRQQRSIGARRPARPAVRGPRLDRVPKRLHPRLDPHRPHGRATDLAGSGPSVGIVQCRADSGDQPEPDEADSGSALSC